MKLIEQVRRHRISLLVGVMILFWAPVIILAKIAGEIVEKEPIGFDVAILNWLHAHANGFSDLFFTAMTNVGGIVPVAVITLLLVLYFWFYKKQRRWALLFGFGVGGAAAANVVLKTLFQRDRPSLWQPSVVETSFSFPSGHAMASAALIACFVVIFWKTRYRGLVTIAGAAIVGLIGVSRLYLGVHYPSDVLAGWCASIAWVTITVVLIRFAAQRFSRT